MSTGPWERRDDWRAGRIQNGKNRGSCFGIVLGPLLFALGLGLSVPIAMAGIAMPPALCALLGTGAMVLIGGLMFIQGVLGWRRSRRFGAATLALTSVPVPRDGAIDGALELSFVPSSPARMALVCTEAVSKSRARGGRHTVTRVLGRVAWTVPANEFQSRDGGVSVPVRHDLPSGLPAATTDLVIMGGTPRHTWTLTCDIEVIGVDFASSFELPVF